MLGVGWLDVGDFWGVKSEPLGWDRIGGQPEVEPRELGHDGLRALSTWRDGVVDEACFVVRVEEAWVLHLGVAVESEDEFRSGGLAVESVGRVEGKDEVDEVLVSALLGVHVVDMAFTLELLIGGDAVVVAVEAVLEFEKACVDAVGGLRSAVAARKVFPDDERYSLECAAGAVEQPGKPEVLNMV